MSASTSAHIVVGYALSTLFGVHERYEEETLYHPKTGQPYVQTNVNRTLHLLGTEIPWEEGSPPEWKCLVCSSSCQVFKGAAEDDELENYVWGCCVADGGDTCADGGGVAAARDVEEARSLVINNLIRMALKNGVTTLSGSLGAPRIYLVTHGSF